MTSIRPFPGEVTASPDGGADRAAPPSVGKNSARRRQFRGQLAAWGFLLPLIAFLLIFYAYPLYKNVDLSLRNYTVRSFVQGGAPFTGFANYTKVFHDPTFGPAVLHTLVFTLVSLLFQFTLGMALALFFFQHFKLSATLRALFLVPWLLPLIVSASTWSWMLNSEAGIVNSLLNAVGVDPVHWLTSPTWALASVIIANIWIGVPFNLVLLYSGLQSISADVYEAAALDGAGAWKRFWLVTFPLLRPVSAITLLLGFVYTLKVFDIIWIMTRGGPADSSTTLATWSYQQGFGNLLIVTALAFGLVYIRAQRKLAI